MKLLVAAICDHAWEENGALTVCRTFDTVSARAFPFVLPRISIALRLLFRRAEAGQHKITILLSDADGKTLMHSEVQVHMQPPPSNTVSEAAFSFALNGQNVQFPAPGDYVVDIAVDGRVEASIPLYVRQLEG